MTIDEPGPPVMEGFKLISIGEHILGVDEETKRAVFDALANDRVEKHYSVSLLVTRPFKPEVEELEQRS